MYSGDLIEVLDRALNALASGEASTAREHIQRDYPFQPLGQKRRPISQVRAMSVFMRDGFIDRYSGERLLFPGALKALSLLLPDVFPAHPN